jgi:anion-transporting  ArsA/GET3 family ATPase
MVKRDLDKSASRFLNALRRTSAGLEQQRQRLLDRAASAPRLPLDGQFPVIDLTGDLGNDLDYYIY